MSIVEVQVTQSDIDNGIRANCNNCPVALAVSRKLGTAVVPGGEYIYVQHGDSPLSDIYDVPDTVLDKITSYDESGLMEPFEFDMKLVGQEPRQSHVVLLDYPVGKEELR